MEAGLLEQLESEHRQVEELFSKLEQAESESEQRPLVEKLVRSLTTHMELEEGEVYPEVYKLDAEMERKPRPSTASAGMAWPSSTSWSASPGSEPRSRC